MALVTAADLKEFSDWLTGKGPTYAFQLDSYVYRYKDGFFDPDGLNNRGFIYYSKPSQTSDPSSIKIIPGDFAGVLQAVNPPHNLPGPFPFPPSVVVSLVVGSPVTLDLAFFGGPLHGTNPHSDEVERDGQSISGFNILLKIEYEQHTYWLEMWKTGFKKPVKKLH